MLRRIGVIAVLLLALCASFSPAARAQDATPGVEVDGVTVLGPEESYADVTRGEWEARSWQWSVSIPMELNPSFDPEGEGCGFGQFGPVFFLPGSYTEEPVTITCVVPEGTALYVGLGGAECSTVEPPPFFGADEAELRACAAAWTDTITDLELAINGEPVPNLEAYRTSSPLFTMTFPEGNYFGVPPGVALSVADSYSLIIAPPPPGEYVLTGSAVHGDFGELGGTIRVIVEAPQVIEPEASPVTSPEATPVT